MGMIFKYCTPVSQVGFVGDRNPPPSLPLIPVAFLSTVCLALFYALGRDHGMHKGAAAPLAAAEYYCAHRSSTVFQHVQHFVTQKPSTLQHINQLLLVLPQHIPLPVHAGCCCHRCSTAAGGCSAPCCPCCGP